ncbi:BTAD domain-containing putative transcriptional regulator [Micromonospora sp. WMMD1120]|uniref:AfsR/SARP family transcriptional regulator n=1 Tax=Micromonospora sp. WMMD1120 TaxID=3016106 RepID=UPI002416FF35|nr:BTAD domain-containing putative transcriptional regulator [Micromonospora sp. WMMD1120]MDG4810695.1 BTAD domain-containing putative transcriptional regulator [Micromonospora sp. WMMD1120]
MEFQVLGDVAASHQGNPVELGRRQERCLLGLLLLEPGRVLRTDRLIELLWNDADATDRRATVHTYVARLRRRLAPYGVRIVTRGGGYLIDVDAATVDLHRFTAEVERTRTIAEPAVRAQALAAALDLWRGPLLAGVADETVRQRLGRDLEERRLVAFEQRVEAELAAGEHVRVVGLLADLVREFPTRERGIELFMLALTRAGRRTEALEVFRDARRTLVEEFGVEPGTDLRRLHQRILADDPGLALPTPGGADGAYAAPRHLPRDVPGFVGRTADLLALDHALNGGGASRGVAAIYTIGGIGGLGKTALAVHWAHRVASRYPDGQVFVNLRGHGADAPTRPIDALGQLLRGLSVPPGRIPVDVDEASALYRSTLADRRVLVVLDNAASSEQVRPLLPASAQCLTIITSRNRLDGLVAQEGARSLRLGLLSDDEAYQLVVTMIGADRAAAAGRDQIVRLVALCGHLPLAVRVAAARVVVDERLTVPDLLGELTNARERLSGLAVEGDAAVRGVFAVSYQALSAASARVFRLLGLVPNTALSAAAVAVLVGEPESRVRDRIADLVDRHLLDEAGAGRYQMHDLLRLYAAERVEAEDSADDRHAAVGRLADAYVQQGVAAQAVFHRVRATVPMRFAHPLAEPPRFDSMDAATEWFQLEGANLLALVRICDGLGLARETWQLTDCQYPFLVRTHALTTLRETQELGVAAARRDDRPDAERLMANGLGVAYALSRDFEQAIRWMKHAAQANLANSSPRDEIVSQMSIGNAYGQKGDWAEAERHLRLAMAGARRLDDTFILCVCLSNLGWLYTEQGRAQESLGLLEEALRIAVDNDITQQIPPLEVHLAHQNANLSRYAETVRHARTAVAHRHLGDRLSTARALYWLGVGLDGLGGTEEAVGYWRESAELMTEIGSGDVEYPVAALTRAGQHRS